MQNNEFPNPYEAIFHGIQKQNNLLEELLGVVKTTPTLKAINYKDTKETARFLNTTENAIRVMVCKNKLKSLKKGNRLFFLESDLIEYIESGRRKTPAELAENCEDILVVKKKGVKANG